MPLHRRVSLMIGRAVLTAVKDGAARQYLQFTALAGETKGDVEHFQPYGFTSHPLPGAQVVFACVAGDRGLPLALVADDPRYRLTDLQPGEVAIFTDEGDRIKLKRGRVVEIDTHRLIINASEKVRLNTPVMECSGDVIDTADTNGETMRSMRETYDIHTHNENNDEGGPTDIPNQLMDEGAP